MWNHQRGFTHSMVCDVQDKADKCGAKRDTYPLERGAGCPDYGFWHQSPLSSRESGYALTGEVGDSKNNTSWYDYRRCSRITNSVKWIQRIFLQHEAIGRCKNKKSTPSSEQRNAQCSKRGRTQTDFLAKLPVGGFAKTITMCTGARDNHLWTSPLRGVLMNERNLNWNSQAVSASLPFSLLAEGRCNAPVLS